MATAVEPSSQPSAPGKPMSLPVASLIGAVYTLASLAVVFLLLPSLWAQHVTPRLNDRLLDWVCWIPAIVGLAILLGWFGRKLAGESAPKGIHGGAFLMTCVVISIFFIARAVGMWVDGGSMGGTTGMVIALLVAAALGYWAYRFFTGQRGAQWMVALEEQGWFSLASYKRSLGVRVRRITILGILLLGATGAWALKNHAVVPEPWDLNMPFGIQSIRLMSGAQEGTFVLVLMLTLWVAFRSVNMPNFAEFLIATEAEMNKVSWSTRRRLAQDTVVVLITTVIMTLFLLVVDLFWGWLLSRERVGVLPARSTGKDKTKVHEAKW